MAENKQEITAPKASVKAKKRTIYSPKGMLELPEWAKKDKEHSYRWISKRQMPRTDGYDRRGWVVARHPDTKEPLEAWDTILARMPLDEFEAMSEYKTNLAKTNLQTVKEAMASEEDKMRFELGRIGGQIKSDFSIERKTN